MGRLFGTNGVRGVVGEKMTPELALKLGRAVGTWTEGPVLVGRDSRTSGPMLFDAFVAGLTAAGTKAVDAGICPTPAVQYSVKHGDYTAGVVITASHNPPEFNGIKVVKADGTELVDEEVDEVEDLYFDGPLDQAGWDEVGPHGTDKDVNERYADGVIDHLGGPIEEDPPLIVLDCANGAGGAVSPGILRRLGARVITVNAQLDGSFPGHPSEPTPENLASTIQTVQAVGADLGITLDGDADRCVFITKDGTYVPGERTLALVAGAKVEANGGGLVVTPVSSSQCVEDHVESHGGRVLHTAVGSPVVAKAMKDERALFGGEENGGLIFPEHQYCRDGTMSAAWLTKHLAETGRPLADLLDEIPTYRLVKEKVRCDGEHKQDVLDAFAQTVEADEVDTTDGVKAHYEDGWVLVRPSGTEPLMRVYAEAKDDKRAHALAEDAKARVQEIVDDVSG